MKSALRSGVRRLPSEGRAIRSAYRQALLIKWRVDAKIRSLQGGDVPDPETVFWIAPHRIEWHTNYAPGGERTPPKDRVFDNQKDKGRVLGGSWDLSDYRFTELDVACAMRERIQSGAPWESTALHARLSEELRARGHTSWHIRSTDDLAAHFAHVDQVIASVRAHGYRANHEIALPGEEKGVDGDPRFSSEITVNIGRDGQYLFQDGRHRLAVAQLLGVESVPVKVLVRHRQWVEFRQFIRDLADNVSTPSHAGELYQSPLHPDLQDIPHAHSCEDRMVAMRKAVGPGRGNLLDIGANFGYFCHGFEQLGYDCHAVEFLPHYALAAETIRIAEGRRFKIIEGDVFAAVEREPLRDMSFSVVLALNIFHHFLKERKLFEQLAAWLSRVRVETMVFEPHCPDEPQMVGAYANFAEQEFVDFILSKSMLNHASLIHRCSDGRPVYRLWR